MTGWLRLHTPMVTVEKVLVVEVWGGLGVEVEGSGLGPRLDQQLRQKRR